MPPSLENPFTPKSALPTKRLFGSEENKRRNIGKKVRENLEKIKVKFGDKMILKSQVGFLKEIEKEIIEDNKILIKAKLIESNKKLSEEDVVNDLAQRIKVDESGNIVRIAFHFLRLTNIPSLDKLTNLQELYCYNNFLYILPSLDKLKYLRRLRCYGNEFSEQEKAKIKSQVPKNCELDI